MLKLDLDGKPGSEPAPKAAEAPKPAAPAPAADAAAPKVEAPKPSAPSAPAPPKPSPAAAPAKAAPAAAPMPSQPLSFVDGVVPGLAPLPAVFRVERRQKMNRMRQRISERLKESQNTAASLTTFNEVDMTSLMEFRKKYQDEVLKTTGVKLGYMGAFAKASVLALQSVPAVNASIEENKDGEPEVVFHDFVDISVAVATPKVTKDGGVKEASLTPPLPSVIMIIGPRHARVAKCGKAQHGSDRTGDWRIRQEGRLCATQRNDEMVSLIAHRVGPRQ